MNDFLTPTACRISSVALTMPVINLGPFGRFKIRRSSVPSTDSDDLE